MYLYGECSIDHIDSILIHLLFRIFECKTQIDVQPLIDIQSSNSCLISTSQTSVPQIYVLFSILNSNRRPILKSMPFFKFSNRRPILKSMAVSHFLKSTSSGATELEGRRFENTLKSDHDLR